ncbi:LysM peptidoglycan-binding domain-containing protein [Yinghuangia sp. ASG 101]|uniref:LysM peptidoglycan-binding domain-containing protein n=1 Tax=Yinghuangia sp. ASG 101 TaxID=2896848 RepID=UPI0022B23FC3|nr:transglycosylase family protein [Yinghuangia sp. ASG 101]
MGRTQRRLRTAAVAGAVVAAPLAGVAAAGSAEAASVSTWDKVAQCESGGNWSINTGNGYYGGLQFTLNTWKAYGGTGMPHQASKSEQIRIAEKVLAGQGPGAWPVCSKKAGLTKGGGSPDLGSTTTTTKPTTSKPSTTTKPSTTKPTTSKPSTTKPTTSKPTTTKPSTSQQTTKPQAAPVQNTAAPSTGGYVVQPGDTLSQIAAEHDVPGGWQALYTKNQSVVGSDADLIFPGQTLTLS